MQGEQYGLEQRMEKKQEMKTDTATVLISGMTLRPDFARSPSRESAIYMLKNFTDWQR